MEHGKIRNRAVTIAIASATAGTAGLGCLVLNATGNLKLAFGAAAIGALTTSVAFVFGVAGGAAHVSEQIEGTARKETKAADSYRPGDGKKSVRMTREEIEMKRILLNLPVPEDRWN